MGMTHQKNPEYFNPVLQHIHDYFSYKKGAV